MSTQREMPVCHPAPGLALLCRLLGPGGACEDEVRLAGSIVPRWGQRLYQISLQLRWGRRLYQISLQLQKGKLIPLGEKKKKEKNLLEGAEASSVLRRLWRVHS